MGLKVGGEGEPLFAFLEDGNYFILLPLFLIGSISIIVWKYQYFKNNAIATFLLITSILWINQSRYFSLFLPIVILYLSELFLNSNKKNNYYINLESIILLLNDMLDILKKSYNFFI